MITRKSSSRPELVVSTSSSEQSQPEVDPATSARNARAIEAQRRSAPSKSRALGSTVMVTGSENGCLLTFPGANEKMVVVLCDTLAIMLHNAGLRIDAAVPRDDHQMELTGADAQAVHAQVPKLATLILLCRLQGLDVLEVRRWASSARLPSLLDALDEAAEFFEFHDQADTGLICACTGVQNERMAETACKTARSLALVGLSHAAGALLLCAGGQIERFGTPEAVMTLGHGLDYCLPGLIEEANPESMGNLFDLIELAEALLHRRCPALRNQLARRLQAVSSPAELEETPQGIRELYEAGRLGNPQDSKADLAIKAKALARAFTMAVQAPTIIADVAQWALRSLAVLVAENDAGPDVRDVHDECARVWQLLCAHREGEASRALKESGYHFDENGDLVHTKEWSGQPVPFLAAIQCIEALSLYDPYHASRLIRSLLNCVPEGDDASVDAICRCLADCTFGLSDEQALEVVRSLALPPPGNEISPDRRDVLIASLELLCSAWCRFDTKRPSAALAAVHAQFLHRVARRIDQLLKSGHAPHAAVVLHDAWQLHGEAKVGLDPLACVQFFAKAAQACAMTFTTSGDGAWTLRTPLVYGALATVAPPLSQSVSDEEAVFLHCSAMNDEAARRHIAALFNVRLGHAADGIKLLSVPGLSPREQERVFDAVVAQLLVPLFESQSSAMGDTSGRAKLSLMRLFQLASQWPLALQCKFLRTFFDRPEPCVLGMPDAARRFVKSFLENACAAGDAAAFELLMRVGRGFLPRYLMGDVYEVVVNHLGRSDPPAAARYALTWAEAAQANTDMLTQYVVSYWLQGPLVPRMLELATNFINGDARSDLKEAFLRACSSAGIGQTDPQGLGQLCFIFARRLLTGRADLMKVQYWLGVIVDHGLSVPAEDEAALRKMLKDLRANPSRKCTVS